MGQDVEPERPDKSSTRSRPKHICIAWISLCRSDIAQDASLGSGSFSKSPILPWCCYSVLMGCCGRRALGPQNHKPAIMPACPSSRSTDYVGVEGAVDHASSMIAHRNALRSESAGHSVQRSIVRLTRMAITPMRRLTTAIRGVAGSTSYETGSAGTARMPCQ